MAKSCPFVSATAVPPRRAKDRAIAIAFGERLRRLRLERGLTQERLAQAAERHPTFISNAERGYSVPTLDTLLLLANALGVQPGELVDSLLDDSE